VSEWSCSGDCSWYCMVCSLILITVFTTTSTPRLWHEPLRTNRTPSTTSHGRSSIDAWRRIPTTTISKVSVLLCRLGLDWFLRNVGDIFVFISDVCAWNCLQRCDITLLVGWQKGRRAFNKSCAAYPERQFSSSTEKENRFRFCHLQETKDLRDGAGQAQTERKPPGWVRPVGVWPLTNPVPLILRGSFPVPRRKRTEENWLTEVHLKNTDWNGPGGCDA